MMTLKFWLSKRSSSAITYQEAHLNRDMVSERSSTNRNMAKLLFLRNVTLNIENWLELQLTKIISKINRNKEATITILNKCIENRKDQLKNRRRV